MHAMVLKQNTYYWNMNITINIITQISNNLKRATCIHNLFTSPFWFSLETLSRSTTKNRFLSHYSIPDFLWDQSWLFPLNTLPIPLSLVSSSPCRSRCKVFPLPRILTYTKCMLANTWLIPLSGILTYTKCMLAHAPNHTSHISFVSDNFITWQFSQQPFTLHTHTFRILSKISTSLHKLSSFHQMSNIR